jgi:hypothetical protein
LMRTCDWASGIFVPTAWNFDNITWLDVRAFGDPNRKHGFDIPHEPVRSARMKLSG